jgi:hypothetical protein
LTTDEGDESKKKAKTGFLGRLLGRDSQQQDEDDELESDLPVTNIDLLGDEFD